MSKFDLETIKTFLTVAQLQSFTLAGKELHKTAATITYRIKSLENHLGMSLFKRNTRLVQLTKEGEHLQSKLKNILNDLDRLEDELIQLNQNIELEFDIAINNLLYDSKAVTQLLHYLTTTYPKTTFRLRREVYNGVWSSLLAEKSHFAIGTPGANSISSRFDSISMGEIQWVFVAAPHHAIRQYHGILPDSILKQYLAINIEDTSTYIRRRKAWLLKGQQELIVPNIETKLALHIAGVGVGFLPYPMVKPYLESGQLISRQVINHRSNSALSFSWNKSDKGRIMTDIENMIKNNHPLLMAFCCHLVK
ncbi:transcriptional regulator [Mergibacter septicus]|uniref:LysR family transcriptional regulator n=1 Tax=Mergibacter septicus TaxID=221402 RepID=UPI00117950E5|nr:LysR family transcriptional regulator [Mergibacter septicus]AWX13492.1 transcriptional regulator [Mergibacter septicus]